MKPLVAVLVLIAGLLAPAAAGDYSLNNRPEVSFKGGPVHVSPYPMSKRAAAVWAVGRLLARLHLGLQLENGVLRPRERCRRLPAVAR